MSSAKGAHIFILLIVLLSTFNVQVTMESTSKFANSTQFAQIETTVGGFSTKQSLAREIELINHAFYMVRSVLLLVSRYSCLVGYREQRKQRSN